MSFLFPIGKQKSINNDSASIYFNCNEWSKNLGYQIYTGNSAFMTKVVNLISDKILSPFEEHKYCCSKTVNEHWAKMNVSWKI